MNEYTSKANSEIQRAILEAHSRNPARSNNIPRQVTGQLQPRVASAGKLPERSLTPPVPPAIIMRRQPPISGSAETHRSTSVVSDLPMHSSNKRKADQLSVIHERGEIHENREEIQRKRAPKKCWKCDDTGCLGATGKQKCTSACKCCGSLECSGRESRYPNRLCPTLLKGQGV